ncbi:hypothetical protein H0H93_002308, partial [Arthromyces matolae]
GTVPYSFKIKNNSTTSYDAAVFMFDVELKITQYNLPVTPVPSSNSPSLVNLPAGESLQIGIGDSGVEPLYLTSKTHDLSGIAQADLFKEGASRTDSGAFEWQLPSKPETFDTLTIPVIMGDTAWLKTMGMP